MCLESWEHPSKKPGEWTEEKVNLQKERLTSERENSEILTKQGRKVIQKAVSDDRRAHTSVRLFLEWHYEVNCRDLVSNLFVLLVKKQRKKYSVDCSTRHR